MEHRKEYHINNSTIKIIFGNILDSLAEVMVNSSGSKMTMGGGLTRAIREAGGEVIREDAQTKLPVNVGDTVVTTAGRLRQKYVFHCITIDKSNDHSNTPEGISQDDIHQYIIGHSIDKCFQLLQAMELTSIAFPAIGAGAAGIPFDKVARVMSEAIAKNPRKTNKAIDVEIYLFDRFDNMSQWTFCQCSSSEIFLASRYGKEILPVRLDMTPYAESIESDIINHDYVVYDKTRCEESFNELLKKIVSTLKML